MALRDLPGTPLPPGRAVGRGCLRKAAPKLGSYHRGGLNGRKKRNNDVKRNFILGCLRNLLFSHWELGTSPVRYFPPYSDPTRRSLSPERRFQPRSPNGALPQQRFIWKDPHVGQRRLFSEDTTPFPGRHWDEPRQKHLEGCPELLDHFTFLILQTQSSGSEADSAPKSSTADFFPSSSIGHSTAE